MSCRLPGYETATPAEQVAALREKFRAVFSSEDGRVVFNALMADLFFFKCATTPEEAALAEYAKFFVRERLGMTDTFALTNAMITTMADRKDRSCR
jgi:hypothetical protein